MPTITFRRNGNVRDNVPIIDGQILFDTVTHQLFMDNGSERYQYGGTVEIVTTTPQARNDNVYSALATNQIFLQKTTVVDTKSNALAVTQNYIPLGCLAFKETIGTTNYSAINTTISGSLVTINNKVTTLENEFTANNKRIYMDYQNGKYGINTSANRGADTFVPFKNTDEIIAALPTSLRCDGSRGGDADGGHSTGNGSATLTMNAPFDGILKITGITFVRDQGGYTGGSGGAYVTYNGVNYGSGAEIPITQGTPITFYAYAGGMIYTTHGYTILSWQWIAS